MRWLLLPLGLAVAATAAWLLLAPPASLPPTGPPKAADGATTRPSPVGARPAPAPSRPMGEIDEASRRALDQVLEREGIE